MNLAERMAAYCADFSYDKLTQTSIHEAKRRVLDSFGCAMGSYLADPPKIAREIARSASSDSTRKSRSWPTTSRKSLPKPR